MSYHKMNYIGKSPPTREGRAFCQTKLLRVSPQKTCSLSHLVALGLTLRPSCCHVSIRTWKWNLKEKSNERHCIKVLLLTLTVHVCCWLLDLFYTGIRLPGWRIRSYIIWTWGPCTPISFSPTGSSPPPSSMRWVHWWPYSTLPCWIRFGESVSDVKYSESQSPSQ